MTLLNHHKLSVLLCGLKEWKILFTRGRPNHFHWRRKIFLQNFLFVHHKHIWTWQHSKHKSLLLHSSTKYSTLQEVQLHSIMMTAFHINECMGWQKEPRPLLLKSCLRHRCFSVVIGVWNYETPDSHCAVMIVGYLSLNGKSLQTIPMNLLVRIGLRLTLSFVWSGDMLEAQQDFSVELRITIQWGFCFTVCASLQSHKSPKISES